MASLTRSVTMSRSSEAAKDLDVSQAEKSEGANKTGNRPKKGKLLPRH